MDFQQIDLKKIKKTSKVVEALSKSYLNVYIVNVKTRLAEIFKLGGYVTSVFAKHKLGPYPYDTICKQYIAERVYDEDKPTVTKCMNLEHIISETKDATDYEFKYRIIENGDIHFYQAKYSRMNDGCIICGFQNIDALVAEEGSKRIELQKKIDEITTLNESLAEYNRIISDAGFGVWHIILKKGAKSRMKMSGKIFDLLEDEFTAMSEEEVYEFWHKRVVPEDIAIMQKFSREMLEGRVVEYTYHWIHPKKGIIYVRVGGKATTLSDGSSVMNGFFTDITEIVLKEQARNRELKIAKDAAELASRAKTSFLLNMSHDIRTPMNAIVGFADLLKQNRDNPEKCDDYIEKIRTSSGYLLSLINNVLEMAKIESGKSRLDESVFKTGEIVKETLSVYSELFKQKHIVFTQSLKNKSEYLYGDTVKLKEIFLNIISNAYKYTPEGGSFSIDTVELPYDRDGYSLMQTTFTDTGIGMSGEYKSKIFEEFSREHSVTDSKIQGTGLGMPIVKKIVDLMGGSITVESSLGKGTTIVTQIPHRVAKAPEQESPQDSSINVDFTGKHILLAEDNELNAEIAIELLKNVGFTIDRAIDGITCINMLQKAPCSYYDVILMDVLMPNMDGYKATHAIRKMKDPCKSQIPIIAMTANAFDEDKKAALDAGMNGHIAKPIEFPKLIKMLSELLA